MMPRLAALSTAEIKERALVGILLFRTRDALCILRRRVSTLRLRRERTAVWRARLEADLVLAMVKLETGNVGVEARGRPESCQITAGGCLS